MPTLIFKFLTTGLVRKYFEILVGEWQKTEYFLNKLCLSKGLIPNMPLLALVLPSHRTLVLRKLTLPFEKLPPVGRYLCVCKLQS